MKAATSELVGNRTAVVCSLCRRCEGHLRGINADASCPTILLANDPLRLMRLGAVMNAWAVLKRIAQASGRTIPIIFSCVRQDLETEESLLTWSARVQICNGLCSAIDTGSNDSCGVTVLMKKRSNAALMIKVRAA